MILPWLRSVNHIDPDDVKVDDSKYEEDSKSEPIILEREYCRDCITPDGELKCSRTHRCMVCKCHLTDDEWFTQKK